MLPDTNISYPEGIQESVDKAKTALKSLGDQIESVSISVNSKTTNANMLPNSIDGLKDSLYEKEHQFGGGLTKETYGASVKAQGSGYIYDHGIKKITFQAHAGPNGNGKVTATIQFKKGADLKKYVDDAGYAKLQNSETFDAIAELMGKITPAEHTIMTPEEIAKAAASKLAFLEAFEGTVTKFPEENVRRLSTSVNVLIDDNVVTYRNAQQALIREVPPPTIENRGTKLTIGDTAKPEEKTTAAAQEVEKRPEIKPDNMQIDPAKVETNLPEYTSENKVTEPPAPPKAPEVSAGAGAENKLKQEVTGAEKKAAAEIESAFKGKNLLILGGAAVGLGALIYGIKSYRKHETMRKISAGSQAQAI